MFSIWATQASQTSHCIWPNGFRSFVFASGRNTFQAATIQKASDSLKSFFFHFPGYRDAEGFVTLSVSLDTDPCLSVMVVTRWNHRDHHCLHHLLHQGVFVPAQRARCVWIKSEAQGTQTAQELQVGQLQVFLFFFFSLKQLVRQLEEECETLSAQCQTAEMHSPSSIWVIIIIIIIFIFF